MFANGPIYDQRVEPVKAKRGRPKKNVDDFLSPIDKDPNAPKRFKSSYICFSVAKQQEIKQLLGPEARVTDVAKKIAETWKSLTPEQRSEWDNAAKADKERYMLEKASYKPPYQEKTGRKRAKKDPSAPKRPMSAFLYFSQKMRSIVKGQNPSLKNTEVSKLLGEMWKGGGVDKEPYVSREAEERGHYKIAIAEWKKNHAAEQEALKKKKKEEAIELKRAHQANLQNQLSNNRADAMQHYGGPNEYENMGSDHGMIGGGAGTGIGGQESYPYSSNYPPIQYADPYAPPSNHYNPSQYPNQYAPPPPSNQYPPHQYTNPYGTSNQYHDPQYSHVGQYEQPSSNDYGNGYGAQLHSSMPAHHYGMPPSQSQCSPDKSELPVSGYGVQAGTDASTHATESGTYAGGTNAVYGGYQQNYGSGHAESYNYQSY